MSETIKTSEHYYTKEFSRYGQSEDNFVANQELTITITLNEYRDLVSKGAVSQSKIDKSQSEKYEAQRENEELKKELCLLKEELYDLTKNKSEEDKD